MGLSRDAVFWDAFVAQADTALQAARLLPEMLDHLENAADYARRIKDLEHQGDKITHETLSTLHKTWITPLDREEIHALIACQDDVLDLIEAAAERMSLYGITEATPEARELVGIVIASTDAVRRAVEALTTPPSEVLVDGLFCPQIVYPARAVVRGDALIAEISAASILAKTARDAVMVALHEQYPDYGFARHKGYGTAEHLAALRVNGVCGVHRRSFAPVRELLDDDC